VSKKVIFTDHSNELLTSYLRDISKYKILSQDEIACFIEKAQQGDDNAKNEVIQSNLRFVVTIAKQFQNRGIPLMDLISSGNEGLIKAVSKYDVTKGTTFLSYAVWWIRQCIYNSIYWQGREIRLPMSQQLILISMVDATNKFYQINHRSPSSEELSEMIDVPREQIDYLSQFFNSAVSVDDYIGGDEDNNQVCDVIPDGEPMLDELINKEYITKEIKDILEELPIRERDLICMYFGIGMPAVNRKTIELMYGVGNERIRQIKESALNKLRKKHGNKLKQLL
jgi:RNA polymerase primary sigma factor